MLTWDENISGLIMDMEYYVGDSCYNSSSRNGWTGEEGCNFRYPVYIGEADNVRMHHKTRDHVRNIAFRFSADEQIQIAKDLHYKFGANQLDIGFGLFKVLKMLERRYGLDFESLEKDFVEKAKAKAEIQIEAYRKRNEDETPESINTMAHLYLDDYLLCSEKDWSKGSPK